MPYYVVLIPPREGSHSAPGAPPRQFVREVCLSTRKGAIALTEAHRSLGYTDADWIEETTGDYNDDGF